MLMNKIKNVVIMSNTVISGLEKMTGYIVTEDEENYFELNCDLSVNDYDYSNSDLTEDLEEELHGKILNGEYVNGTQEDLYNYIKSAIFFNGISRIKTHEEINIYLNSSKIRVWLNSKGFIHIIKKMIIDTNIGKCLANVEFAFSKKKELKEVNYNLISRI